MSNQTLLVAVLISLSVLAGRSNLSAQTDSLVDCFPLSIANQWTYRFEYSYWVHESPIIWMRNDSGTVNQKVVAKVDYPDSVLWTLSESRMYHVHQGSAADGFTDSTLSDSMRYVLVELKTDRHRLYQETSYDQFHWDGHYERAYFSVFPFWRDPWDSLRVYRFCPVDSASSIGFDLSGSYARPNARTFALKKDIGLDTLQMSGTVTLDNQGSKFSLLSHIITDVSKGLLESVPKTFSLFQNYPNPFNPSTTIRYALPGRSNVTLAVLNMLGQQVATLVNGEIEAGHHEVQFDAPGLASGVYFYRLQAGGYTQTRKLLLVR
jgi:hypothetical protein